MLSRHTLSTALALGAVALLGACSDASAPLEPDEAAFAKPANPGGGGGGGDGDGGGLQKSECGGKTDLLDSRVSLTWSGAITGDGFGDTFVGDQDGVHAKVFYHDQGCSVSGDIVFDPDMNGRKVKRHLTVAFPAGNDLGLGTESAQPFINVRAAMQLGSDIATADVVDGRDAKMEAKSALRPRNLEFPSAVAVYPGYERTGNAAWRFRLSYTGIPGCDLLEFTEVQVTRTAGVYAATGGVASDGLALGAWSATDAGAWEVETVGAHEAQCYATSGGTEVPNGAPMTLPFRVTIQELQ